MNYGDYLNLDEILGAQHTRSDAHDELLFIIQHQTSELWMKLALHELASARALIAKGNLRGAFKNLTRVARIFEQLNSAWDVLRTMTPSEYTQFRPDLGGSSGFQSHQYRLVEYALGNRNLAMMEIHRARPDLIAMIEDELALPSLYQVTLERLSHFLGITFPATTFDRGKPYAADPMVAEAWLKVYQDSEAHWDFYELAEKLIDLEDYFRRWRFNHVTTVERIIGFKKGTGRTSGVSYLRAMLDVELFPELWAIRGDL